MRLFFAERHLDYLDISSYFIINIILGRDRKKICQHLNEFSQYEIELKLELDQWAMQWAFLEWLWQYCRTRDP